MSRRRSVSGEFRYLDHEIRLHPTTGKFWCPDYDVDGDTLEQVKAQVKEKQDRRDRTPTQEVWWLDTGMWGEHEWKRGTCTGNLVGARSSMVWVSYEVGGRKQRQQVYASNVKPCNEKNDAIMSQITALYTQREQLTKDIKQLSADLDPLVTHGDTD